MGLLAALFPVAAPAFETPASPHRVLFIVMDGMREETFRQLLQEGSLPHIAALLEEDPGTGRKGIYSPATSVWPSTTGPAYAPFITGLFPGKSNLAGIRLYLRDRKTFRSYAGVDDAMDINADLTRRYPTLYEVLKPGETFSQGGFITRRGWQGSKRWHNAPFMAPLSIVGLENTFDLIKGLDWAEIDFPQADLHEAISFLVLTSPDRNLGWGARRLLGMKDEIDVVVDTFERFPWKKNKWDRESRDTIRARFDVEAETSWGIRLGYLPKFSFVSFHIPDRTSHAWGPGEKYVLAIEQLDEILGFLFAALKDRDEWDTLSVILSADHGTSEVKTGREHHVPVIVRLAEKTGLLIHDSPKKSTAAFNRAWQGSGFRGSLMDVVRTMPEEFYDGIGAVSGNANVQIYLRRPGRKDWTGRPDYCDLRSYAGLPQRGAEEREPVDLVRALVELSAIENVYVADREAGQFHVFSKGGHSVITVRDPISVAWMAEYSYHVEEGEDPLGFQSHPDTKGMVGAGEFFDGNEWAAATRETGYPDAIVQICQLLTCQNAGDLIADAAPGFEPWNEGQAGLHGALRREHLVVPLLVSSNALDSEKAQALLGSSRMPRTVDIYPTMLRLLGVDELPSAVRFKVRKKRWLFLAKTNTTKPVEREIDGAYLDIWSGP